MRFLRKIVFRLLGALGMFVAALATVAFLYAGLRAVTFVAEKVIWLLELLIQSIFTGPMTLLMIFFFMAIGCIVAGFIKDCYDKHKRMKKRTKRYRYDDRETWGQNSTADKHYRPEQWHRLCHCFFFCIFLQKLEKI